MYSIFKLTTELKIKCNNTWRNNSQIITQKIIETMIKEVLLIQQYQNSKIEYHNTSTTLNEKDNYIIKENKKMV